MKLIVAKREKTCQEKEPDEEDRKEPGLLKRRDFFLFLGIFLLILILFLVQICTERTGDTVRVTVGGEETAVYPLGKDQTVEITGISGGTNLLVIRDGTAGIEEADCPDKLCVEQGRISKSGQSIICMPHQVVIEITKEKEEDAPDAYVR